MAADDFVKADVFVSYSRKDTEEANSLTDFLEHKGIRIWQDTQNLKIGTKDWLGAIRDAILEEVSALVVLLSPSSVVSPFVTLELGFAMGFRFSDVTEGANQPEKSFLVLPVVIKDTRDKVYPHVLKRVQDKPPEHSGSADYLPLWNEVYDRLMAVGIGRKVVDSTIQLFSAMKRQSGVQIQSGWLISLQTRRKTGFSDNQIDEIERFMKLDNWIVVLSGGSWKLTDRGVNFLHQHNLK